MGVPTPVLAEEFCSCCVQGHTCNSRAVWMAGLVLTQIERDQQKVVIHHSNAYIEPGRSWVRKMVSMVCLLHNKTHF